MRMAVEERGAGPAVVLVHGLFATGADWDAVATELARDHRVLQPDLIGFGKSERTADPDAIWADAQARALAEALDEAGVERAALVGHDFGGPVVAELTRLRPGLATHVAFVASNLLDDTPVDFPLSLVLPPLVGGIAARALFSRLSLRMMLRGKGAELGDDAQLDATRAIFLSALRQMRERYGPVQAAAERIAVPALVVWGGQDEFFPAEQGARTSALLPNGELCLLEDAEHFMPRNHPDELARALRELLARDRTTAATV
jgi:pimeloyl-ACP methyl ester carboxylesterase